MREMHGRTMFFTNGDVTVQHLMKSLSYMAGPTHRLTLVVREPDVQLMRWVKSWMQRGWTTEVRLTAITDARQLVTAELEGLTDRVTVAQDATAQDELMAFEGERGVVVIQGRLLTATRPGLTMYGCYHRQAGEQDELMQAVGARHKAHALSMADVRGQKEEVEETTTDGTDETDGVVAEATQTKTKTKTKKGKKNGTDD